MRKNIAIYFLILTLLPGPLAGQNNDIAPGWKDRIFSAVGGAILGAGVGYFASQVVASDWDVEGSGKNVHRSTWAAVGGASGLVLGFSIPVGGRAPGSSRSSPVPSRFVITSEQIREASLINAMEAVRFFHPEWLRQQRPDSFADITPDNIQVYLDNVRLERIEDLTQINAIDIESIRFHDTQQATVRWGTGHRFGAIQVLTRN